jgi:hypothetical protein
MRQKLAYALYRHAELAAQPRGLGSMVEGSVG